MLYLLYDCVVAGRERGDWSGNWLWIGKDMYAVQLGWAKDRWA